MSKLGLLLFIIISTGSVQSQEKAVDPRISTPKKVQIKDRLKAAELFSSAADQFYNNKFDIAYSKFSQAAEQEGISPQEKAVASYNAALSLERMKKYKKAIDKYTLLSSDQSTKDILKDSYYRIGACCHQVKDWACVVGSIENWKNYGAPLSLSEEFEYRIRKGSALYELRLYRDTIDNVSSAIKVLGTKRSFIYSDSKKRGFGEGKIDQLALWGLEALAGSYKATGDSIRISYTEEDEGKINMESLSRLLELKAYYYLRSQDAYLEMLNYGDKDSASKGLFLLGELYRDIYKDLLGTEIPPDIKKLKLEKQYTEKLKGSLRPIIEKAKTTYKKNVEISKKYSFKNEWTEKSAKALLSL